MRMSAKMSAGRIVTPTCAHSAQRTHLLCINAGESFGLRYKRKLKRMKTRFRMFRRGNYFWSHDGETGKQESLRTKDKATALRLLHSKNEAYQQPTLNLQIARTYLTASDLEIGKRT